MNTRTPKRLFGLLALVALVAAAAPARAQFGREQRAVQRVQESVRQRILSERGGSDEYVVFNNDAQRSASSGDITVRGTGVYYRDGRGGRERRDEFTYSGVYNARSNNVERTEYRMAERAGNDRDVPAWLVGTFRGRTPSNNSARRGRALVTVEQDGRATVVYGDGQRETGRYRDRQLRLGGEVWNVSRNGDGFRAQDDSSRRAEDFVRVAAGDGGGGYESGDGSTPRWAVGVFRGTTDTGESELTIYADGTATITSLVNYTMHTGRYADGVLTFDWGSFNVTREGDGLRTVQVNSRRNQTSYRRVSDAGGSASDNRAPRWAVGTFRGTTDSGESELSISRDGTAVIRSLVNNTTHTGRFSDGRLVFNWGSFNVTREGNGLRTMDVNNRSNQTSYRRVN